MKHLDIGGKRLEYQRFGSAVAGRPTLVFLHEGLGSLGQWRDFPEQVSSETGCSSLVYSRAGYGHSDSANLPLSIDFMHDEALQVLPQFLTKLREQNVILIGHSDGGSIALIFAANPTVSVRALILLSPHVFVEEITVRSIAEAKSDYLQGGLKRRLAKHHPRTDETFLGWANIWLDPKFRSWNIENVLPKIEIPSLVIQGEEDRFGSLRQVEAIQNGCTGPVETFLIPGCGHRPHIENPLETLHRVVEFIHHNL